LRNLEVASLLNEIADLLELKGDSTFRVGAYRTAATHIENLPIDVASLWSAGRLQELPGIGPSIEAKIGEYLDKGHSSYLDNLRHEVPPGVRDLLLVPGLGPAKAKLIHQGLGIETVEQLREAAEQHRLRQLPGIREKTEEKILREIQRLQQRTRRLLLGVALPAAEEVVALLERSPMVRRVQTAGSLRRMKETIGDIDLLAASEDPASVTEAFARLPVVLEVLARGPTKASVLTRDNLQMDLRVVRPEDYGSALQYFTGSKEHNIALRDMAIRQGYKLNEYGLFKEPAGERLAGEDEESIYSALGLKIMPPEIRENRGELEAAASGHLPHLVEQRDILGDLQVHSEWSDGNGTMEEMAQACIQQGYRYVALTDHSQSLGIAHGLSPERMVEKLREVDRLNARIAPFRILKSSEVDIRGDGSLDYPDEILSQLDFVVVSIHSGFEQSREKVTGRILKAFQNPHVDLLAHPTGRLLNHRPGYDVDLEQVLREAARLGIAVEINASPERLDLDDNWARRAKELGVTISINTDAHDPSHLAFMRYGIAVARRGWVEKRDVLNAMPLEQIMARHRRRTQARAA
jgi:DNA polymerase (family X)